MRQRTEMGFGRRRFLTGAMAAITGFSAVAGAGGVAPAQQDGTSEAAAGRRLRRSRSAGRTGERWFRIGACDWNLGKMASPEAFDVAKEIGLDGVQISLGTLGDDMHLRTEAMQEKYREAMRRTRMRVSSIAIGEMNSIPLKSDPRAAEWLDWAVETAAAMRVPRVMPACFGNGELDMEKTDEIDHFVKVVRHSAEKAERLGIIIALENYLSAEDNLAIIDRIGSPAVQVYYDVGNSTDKGRDVCEEIPKLRGKIAEIHIKDAGYRIVDGNGGRIDLVGVRKVLDEIDYSGWLVLEAAAPNGLVADYAEYRAYLREIFPESPATRRPVTREN